MQPSRSRRTSCCMALSGRTYVHTKSQPEYLRNWFLISGPVLQFILSWKRSFFFHTWPMPTKRYGMNSFALPQARPSPSVLRVPPAELARPLPRVSSSSRRLFVTPACASRPRRTSAATLRSRWRHLISHQSCAKNRKGGGGGSHEKGSCASSLTFSHLFVSL